LRSPAKSPLSFDAVTYPIVRLLGSEQTFIPRVRLMRGSPCTVGSIGLRTAGPPSLFFLFVRILAATRPMIRPINALSEHPALKCGNVSVYPIPTHVFKNHAKSRTDDAIGSAIRPYTRRCKGYPVLSIDVAPGLSSRHYRSNVFPSQNRAQSLPERSFCGSESIHGYP